MARRVGLAVPVYKNFQGFAELMASVDMEIMPFVVDNWRDNRGVSKGWNIGIQRAIEQKCDTLFILNDDAVFMPGTMYKMMLGLSQGNDLVTGFNTRDENYDHLKSAKFIEAPDFSCFVIDPMRFVNRFGWFDENFSPAYFEDNDMHYRMRLAGGLAVKHTKAPFFHKGSVTQNWEGQQVVTGSMFEKNREYYRWKWGGLPGEETRTEPNIQPQDEEIGLGI